MITEAVATEMARKVPLPKTPSEAEEKRVEAMQMAARRRFGARIKQYRVEQGLSLRALGYLCNLSPAYLSGVERGAHAATIDQIIRLGHFLRIDPASFFSD